MLFYPERGLSSGADEKSTGGSLQRMGREYENYPRAEQKAALAPIKGRGTAPTLSINAHLQDQDTLGQTPIAAAEITQHYNSL